MNFYGAIPQCSTFSCGDYNSLKEFSPWNNVLHVLNDGAMVLQSTVAY